MYTFCILVTNVTEYFAIYVLKKRAIPKQYTFTYEKRFVKSFFTFRPGHNNIRYLNKILFLICKEWLFYIEIGFDFFKIMLELLCFYPTFMNCFKVNEIYVQFTKVFSQTHDQV
jgi:hypothetical protein